MKKIIFTLYFICLTVTVFAQIIDKNALSGFPNYHPLVVHFPIILLLIAATVQTLCILTGLFFRHTKCS